MGEHIRLHGRSVKLGTCEDLYYVTFEQLRGLAGAAQKAPGNLPPREYLNPEYGWRYRFPFPEEDGLQAGEAEDYDKGRVFSCPPALGLPPDRHGAIHVPIGLGGVRGSGFNVNYRLPCPAAGRPGDGRVSPLPDSWPVEIVQQRFMPCRQLWAVCRCGWCGEKYRLDPDDGAALVAYLRTYDASDREYWDKVCDRIEAGYAMPPE